MDLTELKNKIISSFTGAADDLADILFMIEEDRAIYPFNEYEHLICRMLDKGGISYSQYIEIRTEYIRKNPNLWIFEIAAPRGFGERFAQTYIQGKCSKLQLASKQLDSSYTGEYDLWLDGITIEVKASRAVDSDSHEPLYMKALSRHTKNRFLMNFQQLKPQCCDVFIWVAVFRDEIVIWIMSSDEVRHHALYSKGQHRGNKGNEGQLHIKHNTLHLLSQFELKDDNMEQAIRDAAHRKESNNPQIHRV
jgi:hypothetical protein